MRRLKRKFYLIISGDVNLSKSKNIILRPLGYFRIQGGFLSAGAGAVLESNYLSINAILLGDNGR